MKVRFLPLDTLNSSIRRMLSLDEVSSPLAMTSVARDPALLKSTTRLPRLNLDLPKALFPTRYFKKNI